MANIKNPPAKKPAKARSPLGHVGVALKVVFHPEEVGGYSVEVPALRGCCTQGETLEEAVANARDAIALWIETAQEVNPPEPDARAVVMELPL